MPSLSPLSSLVSKGLYLFDLDLGILQTLAFFGFDLGRIGVEGTGPLFIFGFCVGSDLGI